jgi:protein angel
MTDHVSVEYMQPGVSCLDKDNIGLLAKFRSFKTRVEFCVATTHLLYNPRRHDIKLAQVVLLLAGMQSALHCIYRYYNALCLFFRT